MKNWIKVNKKDLENTLSHNKNVEFSKTSDGKYSDIYLVKVRKINKVKCENKIMEESKINDLIDAKLFSALETISSNTDYQYLFESLEKKFDQKINELKSLTTALEEKMNGLKETQHGELIHELNSKMTEINQLNKDLDLKLESKLDEIKVEFKNIEQTFNNVNKDLQAQTRTSGKNFDYLIKKTTRMVSRLDIFDRDVKKIKAIPEIRKELIVKKVKAKPTKVKTLNAINERVIKPQKSSKKN